MGYLPVDKDICQLTCVRDEEQAKSGEVIIPCIVTIEYQNDYCWLIRYCDSEQCNMIKKSDKRYFFKRI